MSSAVVLETYEYDELPRGDIIRYLTLHAGIGDDRLRCTLHIAPMAETEYEAVSYVWGSDVRDQEIECDGRTLALTTNLFHVLHRVRQPHQPRSLWADLICINQENLDEKSYQVGIMGSIYRHATRVLIHVGIDDKGHGPQVCSLLDDVVPTINAIRATILEDWNTFPHPRPDDHILDDARWDSLGALLDETWFSRGWVVREAGFAQHGHVYWGSVEFRWEALMQTISWLYKRGVKALYAKKLDSRIPLAHLEVFEDRNSDYAKLFTTDTTWVDQSLLGYLCLTRPLNLKDPRDRIYAFMELVDNKERQIRILPNYKAPFLRVYQDFAIEVIADGALKLEGVLTDQIIFASNVFDDSTTTPKLVFELWEVIASITTASPYPDKNRLSVFIGTLTAGTREGDVLEWLRSEAAYYQFIYEMGGCPKSLDPPSWLAQGGTIELYHHAVRGYTHNRKIILTQRGYFGLAPAVAQKGDTCGIIFGCATPSILRPSAIKHNYQYLGAAFMFGQNHSRTADGRVLFHDILGSTNSRDWVEWDVQEQDIVLC
ncbi:heterokaryon incompatibility protein-domain-containing protein [Paraphoma chrysanthemicola]|nr:heterokaryon incompatibility protein-domain-containing protein [Paraphoma chrysanthemicola]